ncbi:inositol 1,4,5-triphosphate receptor associated 1 isoform X2 [Anabrus simplex]
MNDGASAGDTASISSASASASVSAVDSMDAPPLPLPLPNGIAEMPPLPANRPMRRCVSDVGLEPNVAIFPSLPDSYLEQLGLVYDQKPSNESTADQDTENKFVAVSLAMKTDRLTLEARFQKQKKLWDQAMRNVEQEAINLNAALHRLNYLCTDSESVDILTNIKEQVSFLLRAVEYVSGNAETLGAVRQEARVSRAWDVAVTHTENVKLLLENAKTDLEDTRRMLTENRQQRLVGPEVEPATPTRVRTSAADRPGSKRRASIATIARPVTPAGSLHTSRSFAEAPGRTRSALRMAGFFPRSSTNESSLASLDAGDLAENPGSVNGDVKEKSVESAEGRVDQSLDNEQNDGCVDQHDEEDNFLKQDDDDAFIGEDHDGCELPEVGDTANLLDEPITLFRCQQTSPTVRWIKEQSALAWATLDTILDNVQCPDMEQVITSGRKFVVGVLLVAAACCIIQIFVPVSGASNPELFSSSIQPWLQIHKLRTPPT